MKGDPDDPFTHDVAGENRCYKWCRCSKCECISVCTPSFDFYGPDVPPRGGPLECEQCLRSDLHDRGVRTDALPPMRPRGAA